MTIISPFIKRLQLFSLQRRFDVCDNWLSSFANIKLDLEIWLNPKPPLLKDIILLNLLKSTFKLLKL